MKLRSRLALVALFLASVGSPLFAATTFTWTAGGMYDGSTTNASNWGGTVPTSDATNTLLVFPNVGTNAFNTVSVNASLDVYSIAFTGAFPDYHIYRGEAIGLDLGIGAGGISVGSGGSSNGISMFVDLRLLANQTWNVAGKLTASGKISGAYSLTKTGTGTLTLSNSNSTFSGGLDLQQGTLSLQGSSIASGGSVLYGPVGTGSLTLRNGTNLTTGSGYSVSLDNAILLESGVTLGAGSGDTLTLAGAIALQSASTAVTLQGNSLTTLLTGNISGASSLTFGGGSAVALAGTNSYTGGTTANAAAVIFYGTKAIPTTGSIGALNNGYVSGAFDGGVAAIRSMVGSPSTFTGSLGMDTPSGYGTVTFNDSLSLSAFDPTKFIGIGTYSSAIFAGSTTPVGSGDYKFGGGNGTLAVTSALAASGSAGVTVSSPITYTQDQRLTVYLRGANTFTGNINVSGSNLIFDGATALPANTSIVLGSYGYAGYTERATNITDFATFKGKIAAGPAATGIIGIDSFNRPQPVTVTDAINLSSLSAVYLGTTATTGMSLTGTITAPSGGTLYLTGVNGGYLKIGSALTAGNVSAVKVGYASTSPALAYNSYVELDNGGSTYAGNTTLDSGYLLLGASSVLSGSTITNGPIGTGTLVVSSTAHSPGLAITSSAGVTLHNNISLLGTNLTIHPDPSTGTLPTATDFSLTLNGVISGTGGITYLGGFDGILTLGGANTFSGGFSTSFGPLPASIVANSNTAFGSGMLSIESSNIQFNTSAPVLGGLTGSYGTITLSNNSSLQINQQQAGNYGGTISGGNVTVTKTGSASLTLNSSDSSYTGTTNVNQGKLILSGTSSTEGSVTYGPVGGSTVALNGGELRLMDGTSITNPITFTAPSRLSGTGTFGAALTINSNATLAPGASPGLMSFSNGLTFASGGVYEVEIQSATGTVGTGFDGVVVSGTLVFTSTSGSPFRLDLISLSTSGTAGNVSDFSATSSYSWPIAITTGGITGFSASVVTINATGFTNALSGGSFSVTASGNNLLLNFTPIPEPSTWALLVLGLGGIAIASVRRRNSGR